MPEHSNMLTAEAFLDQPERLRETLEGQGTLAFSPHESGLFSASDLTPEMGEATGQGMAWLRDNAHVINALRITNQHELAGPAGEAICRILLNNEDILDDVAQGDLSRRLPVRVDSNTLKNDTEPRIQNDAVGYALWSAGCLIEDGVIRATKDRLRVLDKTVTYLEKIYYWRDADDGHWEEKRNIHFSSVGTAFAGLQTVQRLFNRLNYRSTTAIDPLLSQGQATMFSLFARDVTQVKDAMELNRLEKAPIARDDNDVLENPRDYLENFNPDQRRRDAALLFLVEPLHVFRGVLAQATVKAIEKDLMRDRGIARYPGDTYWSPRFKDIMPIEERTTAAEGRAEMRDRIAAGIAYSGKEAQWTLFDPLLSVYWGKQYIENKDLEARAKQLHHLNRSLAQLTIKDGSLRMPEAYYYDYEGPDKTGKNVRIPNDHTPLLWSQANLLLALNVFEKSGAV